MNTLTGNRYMYLFDPNDITLCLQTLFTREGLCEQWNELVKCGELQFGGHDTKLNDLGSLSSKGSFHQPILSVCIERFNNLRFAAVFSVLWS